MKKIYVKPLTRVIVLEQEHILRCSTFENYAKQNEFVEDENDEDSSDGLIYTQPSGGSLWTDEDEE